MPPCSAKLVQNGLYTRYAMNILFNLVIERSIRYLSL